MTCIVAMHVGSSIYMASDSLRCMSEEHSFRGKSPKFFRLDGFVVGVSGVEKTLNVLRHKLTLRGKCGREDDLSAYMSTVFVQSIKETLSEAGYLKQNDGQPDIQASVLVGGGGRLFYIDSHLSCSEPSSGFFAIGSGAPYAMGAMDALGMPAAASMGAVPDAMDFIVRLVGRHCPSVGGFGGVDCVKDHEIYESGEENEKS